MPYDAQRHADMAFAIIGGTAILLGVILAIVILI